MMSLLHLILMDHKKLNSCLSVLEMQVRRKETTPKSRFASLAKNLVRPWPHRFRRPKNDKDQQIRRRNINRIRT